MPNDALSGAKFSIRPYGMVPKVFSIVESAGRSPAPPICAVSSRMARTSSSSKCGFSTTRAKPAAAARPTSVSSDRGGDEDGGRGDPPPAQRAEHIESVHRGHAIIHDQAIGLANGIGVKEFADIAESADLEPLGLKHEAERIQDRRIVVDDKNQRSRDHRRKALAPDQSAPFHLSRSLRDSLDMDQVRRFRPGRRGERAPKDWRPSSSP